MLRKLIQLIWFFTALNSYSQVVTVCPPNIGFENGTLNGWETYIGGVVGRRFADTRPVGTVVVNPSPFGRQDIIKRETLTDEYGHFSLNSPNGSEYVVRLGNSLNGAEAEMISYTLTVPKNVNSYSIIFNYAVVFEDRGHPSEQQPKFRARVVDVASNTASDCGSFEFVALSGLPGFFVSDIKKQPNADVLYKPWSPVFVNLDDYIGRTIRLEFTTNDCSEGGHFGYAYIDFNENCSIPVTGNIICPDVDEITLKIISGFFHYRWYNAETLQDLGDADTVLLSPVPRPGTRIAVELIPYPGLGCTQTIYTTISGIELSINDPPPDCFSVDLTAQSVHIGNSSDLTYTYWRNPQATLPILDPKAVTVGGTYYIMGRSSSGCVAVRPVVVVISPAPIIAVIDPEPVIYPAGIDITRSFPHEAGFSYSYWFNSDTTRRLPNPSSIVRDGTYYIKGISLSGCITIVPVTVDIIFADLVIPNTFTPNGDGTNDVLTILMDGKVNIKYFKVFNRWGDVVFTTIDIENFWDGLKDGQKVPTGVYYWLLEGVEDSAKYTRSGSVTVIR